MGSYLVTQNSLLHLHSGSTSLVLSTKVGAPLEALYWGPRLAEQDAQECGRLSERQHAHGSPAQEVPAALLNDFGSGYAGPPSFEAHIGGHAWARQFAIETVKIASNERAMIVCKDQTGLIAVVHDLELCQTTDILSVSLSLMYSPKAKGGDLTINRCDTACLPLPQTVSRITSFTGRWANEFQTEEVAIFIGTFLRESRAGRTSHDSFPGLIFSEPTTQEQAGLCYGLHLGWSGNHRLQVDRLSDGRQSVQAGELLLPGEVRLAPGERYEAPPLYCAVSNGGLSNLSQKFHAFVREKLLQPCSRSRPRPVHYNTWEAVYFDLDESKLMALADKAASIGIERFVLDDGWFGGRRSDKAGLGDWYVSEDVFPNGLTSLIEHVNGLGMEFGIWVEPEMVNPDSDLYRAHPDWVLGIDGIEQVDSRNQYVLDLTNPDVTDYLFERLDELLTRNNIGYLKWDMNRNIHHPDSGGKAVTSQQTHDLYGLIHRLQFKHPKVVIESCASGGGRADFGILFRKAERIWTSDSNDALDRQIIQRGASHFFPIDVLGAHVGPKQCHITGRTLSIDLRVATALFGHMGVELDLGRASEEDLGVLKAGIELHKQYRVLIHSGAFYRIDTADDVNAISVVSEQRDEALLSWCQMIGHRHTLPDRIRFVGLDPSLYYRCRIVWPLYPRSQTCPSIIETLDLAGHGSVISGRALMDIGLQAPLLYPESCLIFHLEAAHEE